VVWVGSEPDLESLLSRGELFTGPVVRKPGARGRCHENTAHLWGKDVRRVKIATGYCLNDDGLWRQHSWAMKDEGILETTIKRTKYYGIVLEGLDLVKFWVNNLALGRWPDFFSRNDMKEAATQYPAVFPFWEECCQNERRMRNGPSATHPSWASIVPSWP
jgi:hypothetical protein